MATDLILYNYCTSLISQEKAYVYLEEFLDVLEEKGVAVNTIKLQDGNKLYPSTHKLIREIMDFWYKRSLTGKMPVQELHCSFYFLKKYLNHELKDLEPLILDCFPDSEAIRSSLISFLVSEKIQPAFFNSVLITGDLYNLEYPFGVEFHKDSISGRICINANLEKKSIWHETAHMLGADDHYVRETETETEECICPTGKNCLMAWDSLDMNFCQHSICEMQKYLNSRNNQG